MPKKRPRRKTEPTVAGVVGVGLDGDDGQTRVTQTDEMLLLGGSEQTHEQMQETAIRFGEELEKRGKALPEVTVREAIDLLREAISRTGQ
jgi:hypothetical protein